MDAPINPVSSGVVDKSAAVQAMSVQGLPMASDAAKINISSLDDLMKKAPQVYNALVMAIANEIRGFMQRSQERLERELRKSR